jgi:DNA polymerase-3 subunit alpha
MKFCHLRVRTEYSILNSVITISNICDYLKKSNSKAIGMMDDMNLSGGLNFSQNIKDYAKPIIGLNVFLNQKKYQDYNIKSLPSLGLIAKNENGYKNLLKILYKANFSYEKSSSDQKYIFLEDLDSDLSKDLIAITGGYFGCLLFDYKTFSNANSEQTLSTLLKIFGDNLYIELNRHARTKEQEYEDFLVDIAYRFSVPLVATNDVYFYQKKYFESYDALSCIRDKTFLYDDNRYRLNHEYYLKNEQEMLTLFSDIPEAIENTIEIAKRCSFFVNKRPASLPSFISDEGALNENESLKKQATEGLQSKISQYNFQEETQKQSYLDRLDYELSIITKIGFAGYFLIVSDFIRWAKSNNIAVGPGRGSGAGSIVAWALDITGLDPLKYGLLFERFLNPERVSMPDFDIDFCQERRGEVIEYVTNKYGRDRVASIITYGKLQAKAVLKDVARVMQIPYNRVDEISKMIPFNPIDPITLVKAIEMDPKLQDEIQKDPDIKQLIDISIDLEGLNRHSSVHAAGIVIADKPLIEIAPIHKDENLDSSVLAYDMKDAEKIGLVKFDFLGLKTLTVISKTCKTIKQQKGQDVEIDKISLSDSKVSELFQSGNLKGIFQLEAATARNALQKIKASAVEDLMAVTSLIRPGPMAYLPNFIRRKCNEEQIDYYYEPLKNLLQETCGIIIYQEQVMEIARILADYSLGAADLLRRAMGKKNKEEMDKQYSMFVGKACEKGLISKHQAENMFAIIEKFAGYGFNKSHAAAYSIISYQTAYLKAHYAVEFLTSMLNLDIDDTDKINEFVNEAKQLGIELILPDINKCSAYFRCEDNKIYYGLAAIKGVGTAVVEKIIEERENSHFLSLQDFLTRCGSLLNKKSIENFIKSGTLECFSYNKRTLLENLKQLIEFASNSKQDKVVGLFGSSNQEIKIKNFEDYSDFEKLQIEFEAIGFYLSRHPLSTYSNIMKRYSVIDSSYLKDLDFYGERIALIAGVVTKVIQRFKKNSRFAFLHLSDLGGIYETMIFKDELITKNRDNLVDGKQIILSINIKNHPDNGTKITVLGIHPIEEFVNNASKIYAEFEEKNKNYKKLTNRDFTLGTVINAEKHTTSAFQNKEILCENQNDKSKKEQSMCKMERIRYVINSKEDLLKIDINEKAILIIDDTYVIIN